ncbi:hypothetical protein L596_018255 [Steinernema carpocapsae]|uniref:Uncharacterized protein n=1 Tax=Steinernema carpocapsae TaxID=34508 RepID=A0A4V6A204_STECR|nr:hypothetical protein L596_018255 [Steinernema carpocapsae]
MTSSQHTVREVFTNPVNPEEILATKQHEQFAMMVRLGSASFGCSVVIAIGICAMSVCTKRIGIFFHLYLSLIFADCLHFVSSYFAHRLPHQVLLTAFYENIGHTYNVNRLVFASFYGNFAHKLATVLLTLGWILSVCLRPIGVSTKKRKLTEKIFTMAAILFTWLLGAFLSLQVLFTPLSFHVTPKFTFLEDPSSGLDVMKVLTTCVTVACALLGTSSLIVGITILKSAFWCPSTGFSSGTPTIRWTTC